MPSRMPVMPAGVGHRRLNKGALVVPSSSMSAIFLLSEWMALQGTSRINSSGNETTSGLLSLQTAFLEASAERLTQPLQFLFPASVLSISWIRME
eukprot:scaffold121184_cov64-Attheya_sp.AAC.3